jgi:hypothetical protein
MQNTLTRRRVASTGSRREAPVLDRPELIDWLRSGKLRLVNTQGEAVSEAGWSDLPAEVRARTLAQFHRVVRGSAKAAVLIAR